MNTDQVESLPIATCKSSTSIFYGVYFDLAMKPPVPHLRLFRCRLGFHHDSSTLGLISHLNAFAGRLIDAHYVWRVRPPNRRLRNARLHRCSSTLCVYFATIGLELATRISTIPASIFFDSRFFIWSWGRNL